MYATKLVTKGRVKSADSLANYISAVQGSHEEMGMTYLTPSQFGTLKHIISGMRRIVQRPVKKSLPVSPVILINFL